MSKTPKLWKSPAQVNTTDHAFGGEIAGLQDGGYVVVWENAGFHSILGQRYDSAGNKVGGEVLLSPSASNNNYGSPAVTILSNGNVAVAFTHLDSSAPDLDVDIYVRIFGPALDLLRTDTIDTSNAKQTYDPSLTALADGSYVVAYTAGVGDITPTSLPDDTDIVARIVSPTGVVGGQFDIDNQNDNRDLSQLATLSNGNFVAVYQDEFLGSATDSDIRFGIFTPTGAHVGLPGFYVPGANGSLQEHDPDVAALRDGGFVVVWTDPDNGVHIQAAILSNTGTLVRDNITLDSTSTDHEASVVALADGGFLVSWEASGAGDSVSLAQRFDADGDKIGAMFTVKDDDTTGETPQAALLSDGHIAFALDDPSAGGHDVMTSIFSVDTPNDFNADGTSDILWQRDDGTPRVWLMDGLSPIFGVPSPNPGAAWHVIDAGDFDGDGRSDVLWQGSDGTPAIWLMNGTKALSIGAVGPFASGALAGWQVKASGDFNGDGNSDILWQGSDGTPAIWLMDGMNAVWFGAVGPFASGALAGWQIKGSGDFNGDGNSDILWQGSDGTPAIWLMDGTNVLSFGAAGSSNPGPNWQIAGSGDYDGDGNSDILWQGNSGLPAIWLMDGLSATGGAILPNPGSEWHIIA